MTSMFTIAQVKAIAAEVESHFETTGADATVELILAAAAPMFAALVKTAPAMAVAAPAKGVQAFPHFQSLITDKLTAEVRAAVEAAIGTVDVHSVREYSDKTKILIEEIISKGEGDDLFTVQPNLTAAIAAAKKYKFSGFALAGFLWRNLTAEQQAVVKSDGGVAPAAVAVAAVMAPAAPKSSSGAKKQGHNIIKSAISAAAAVKDNAELKALIDQLKTHLGKTSGMDLGNGLWKRMTKAQQTEWHDVSATMPADKTARDMTGTFDMLQVHLQASADNGWAIVDAK